MSTHVEIDISLPLGAGPDGHIALRVDIPDLAAVSTRDREYVSALIKGLAEWVPHPGDGVPAEVPPVLRPAAMGRGA